ncbi:MAG TPA: HypC/HybG/HupF family hydrogenase formation chaperone [Desulfomonilia bacterium]
MCIAFPGKVISINEDNFATIDIGGTRREVSLDLMDEPVNLGDYLISHAGYAMHKVDEASARESLEVLKEIMENETY